MSLKIIDHAFPYTPLRPLVSTKAALETAIYRASSLSYGIGKLSLPKDQGSADGAPAETLCDTLLIGCEQRRI